MRPGSRLSTLPRRKPPTAIPTFPESGPRAEAVAVEAVDAAVQREAVVVELAAARRLLEVLLEVLRMPLPLHLLRPLLHLRLKPGLLTRPSSTSQPDSQKVLPCCPGPRIS